MVWTLKTTCTLPTGAKVRGIRFLTANSISEAVAKAGRLVGPNVGFSISNIP